MSAGFGQVGQVEPELGEDSVGDLAHFDGFDLGERLRARSVLQGLQLAEHVHVLLELELGGPDDISHGLSDGLSFQSEAHIIVLLLNSLGRLGIVQVGRNADFVVLDIDGERLACLVGHGEEAAIVLGVTLTEDPHVLALVLRAVSGKLPLVELSLDRSEHSSGLPRDNCPEEEEVFKFEGAIGLAGEVAVELHGFAHRELWALVLGSSVSGSFTAPQVVECHSVIFFWSRLRFFLSKNLILNFMNFGESIRLVSSVGRSF